MQKTAIRLAAASVLTIGTFAFPATPAAADTSDDGYNCEAFVSQLLDQQTEDRGTITALTIENRDLRQDKQVLQELITRKNARIRALLAEIERQDRVIRRLRANR